MVYDDQQQHQRRLKMKNYNITISGKNQWHNIATIAADSPEEAYRRWLVNNNNWQHLDSCMRSVGAYMGMVAHAGSDYRNDLLGSRFLRASLVLV